MNRVFKRGMIPSDQALSNLIEWMQSWRQSPGAYGGYVVHAIHGVENLNYTGPQPFPYLGIIEGFLILYEKTKNEKYLEWAEEAARNLAFKLLDQDGCFKYSLFEYNPEKWNGKKGFALVHNAFADIALLKFADFIRTHKKESYKIYTEVARKNIDWLIAKIWKGRYLTGCLNQDMALLIAFILYHKVSGDPYYLKKFGLKMAEWACGFKTEMGGFRRGVANLNYVSPWYDSIVLMSFLELYEATGDHKWLSIAEGIGRFILSSVDPSLGGLYHSWQESNGSWKVINRPLLIAPVGYTIYTLRKLSMISNKQYSYNTLLRWVLSNQKLNGAFPSSQGFGDWRDRSTVIGWNHFMLLCLSDLVSEGLEGLLTPLTVDVSIDFAGNDTVVEDRKGVSIYRNGVLIGTLWKFDHGIRRNEVIYPSLLNRKEEVIELMIGSNNLSDKKISIETYMDNTRLRFKGYAENVTLYLKLYHMVKGVFLDGERLEKYRLIKNIGNDYTLELTLPKLIKKHELLIETEGLVPSEQRSMETIKGIVTDERGKPLRAKLELVSESFVKHTTDTHEDGSFSIKAALGEYILICSCSSYRPFIRPFRTSGKEVKIVLYREAMRESLRRLFSKLILAFSIYVVKHRINPLIDLLGFVKRLIANAEGKFKQRFTPA